MPGLLQFDSRFKILYPEIKTKAGKELFDRFSLALKKRVEVKVDVIFGFAGVTSFSINFYNEIKI